MRSIVVATDGSESASRAVDFAAQLARLTQARLNILNVIDTGHPLPAGVAEFSRQEHAETVDTRAAWSEQLLEEARGRAVRSGIAEIALVSRTGSVAASVLECLRDCEADTVVLGRRGRGRVAGALLGSVSQALACTAPCPMIIVP